MIKLTSEGNKMKTLADLKRSARQFEFKLIENSWFNSIPAFQNTWRKVGRIQSNRFTLLTDKEGNFNFIESWIDFPKASEMQLIQIENNKYTLIIKRDCGNDKPPHIMIYELRRI